MNRRTFLNLMGLGLLTSISPLIISACLAQNNRKLRPNSSPKDLESVLFYVSPSGDDGWSGKQNQPNADKTDGPFATLQKARDAVRELKHLQGGTLQQPVTVLIRGGTYFLSEPLVFNPQDSGTEKFPIAYKAYENEKPVISGGRPITGWRQQGNLWVTNLPEVKTGKWYFRLLRVGNDWAIRARYPNFDPNNPLTGGWLFAQRENKPWEKGAFNTGVYRIHNIGDRLEWNISVPAAGNYKVWVRYAHKMKGKSFNSMDGRTAIRSGNAAEYVPLVNLSDTGGFGNFSWALAATIYLPSGDQTLIWENIKGGGINLDAFCLTDEPSWNPETAISFIGGERYKLQPPPAEKHLLVIQAEACTKAIAKEVKVSDSTPALKITDNRISIAPNQFPNWQNWQGAEIHVFMDKNYGNSIFSVTNVDKENYTLFGNFTDNDYIVAPGNRFFIENVREALDSPGEWYLDTKIGELIYSPTASDFLNRTEIVAPVMEKLFVLQGNMKNESFVEYLNFQGLTFTDTDYTLADDYLLQFTGDAAIWLSQVRQCVIEDCNFTKLGGFGVRLDRRSHGNQIVRNKMADLGQGGIHLLGNAAGQPFNNLIAYNDIHDCGKVYKHVAGVFVTTGSGNRIAHNRIYRMPRYGISIKSFKINNYSHNNVVEFNEIVDTCLETNDAGAIEMLGRDKQLSGNIIRFNFICNVVGMGTNASGQIVSPYFTKGFHLDDFVSGTTIYGNIVVDTLESLVVHGGRDNLIENNIFINGEESQIRLTPSKKDPQFMKNNIIRRNIFVFKEPKTKLLRYFYPEKTWQREHIVEWDFNLYWYTGKSDLKNTEKAITPLGNFTQWQALGFDRNSLFADPLIASPEKGDFRLKGNSPAFQLGFQPIPVERIGLENTSFRQ